MYLTHLVAFVRRYMRYRATINELSQVDERTLRDIGLTRGQIIDAAWTCTR